MGEALGDSDKAVRVRAAMALLRMFGAPVGERIEPSAMAPMAPEQVARGWVRDAETARETAAMMALVEGMKGGLP